MELQYTGFEYESITLPARCFDGEIRTYTVEPTTAMHWVDIIATSWQDAAAKRASHPDVAKWIANLDDRSSEDMRALVLGQEVSDKMTADGVVPRDSERIVNTVMIWFVTAGDEKAAKAVFINGGKAPLTRTTSSSTGQEGSTPTIPTATPATPVSPARGSSTTTSRRKSSPPSKTSPRAGRGKTSSVTTT